MKIYNFLIICCLSLFFTSCSKDDGDKPVLNEPIADILGGNYWNENIYFVYEEHGETRMSDLMTQWSQCPWEEAHLDWNVLLGYPRTTKPWECPIFVMKEPVQDNPNEYGILYYMYNTDDYKWYSTLQYTVSYDPGNWYIKVTGESPDLNFKNAVAGSQMKIVSATPERVEFDVPLKEYVRYALYLGPDYNPNANPDRRYTGIRVVWTKLQDTETYQNAIRKSSMIKPQS